MTGYGRWPSNSYAQVTERNRTLSSAPAQNQPTLDTPQFVRVLEESACLVRSQLEYDEQADADLSPLPSRERARACPVLDTGVRVNCNIKTMLTRY